MNFFWLIIFSVMIAALIGGLTNHLAIKMLFHPRIPWSFFGRRVPFTPGLIPKRRDEIASSLGRIVSDYLVTSAGLSELLQKDEFRETLRSKLHNYVHSLAEREETIEQLCMRIWPAERWQTIKLNALKQLGDISVQGVDWLWNKKGWSKIKAGELLPDWTAERREVFVQMGVRYIVDTLRAELTSSYGDQIIRNMTKQLIEQAGGFLGTLAVMFLDEEKISYKVKASLIEALDSEAIRISLKSFVSKQTERIEAMTLEEITNACITDHVESWLAGLVKWEKWTDELLAIRLDGLLNKHMSWIEDQLPTVVRVGMNMLEHNLERIFRAIQLEQLVAAQVRLFPIERLESIILSVSGKEFRAITYLGALLGGMIGLIQALLLRWIG